LKDWLILTVVCLAIVSAVRLGITRVEKVTRAAPVATPRVNDELMDRIDRFAALCGGLPFEVEVSVNGSSRWACGRLSPQAKVPAPSLRGARLAQTEPHPQ